MEPLRVASIPATHVYVQRLEHPRVRRIQDPSGDDLRTPCLLDPVWVDEHAAGFDVFHVHFGVEFYEPERIETLADVLDRHGSVRTRGCNGIDRDELRRAVLDAERSGRPDPVPRLRSPAGA